MIQATVGHLLRGEEGKQELLIGVRNSLFCNGTLAAPGGKCKGEEIPLHCLRRELREEIGVRIGMPSTIHFATVDYYKPSGTEIILNQRVHFFNVTKWTGTPQPLQGYDSLEWHPLSNLPYARMHADLIAWLPMALSERERILKGVIVYEDTQYKVIKKTAFEFVPRPAKVSRKRTSVKV